MFDETQASDSQPDHRYNIYDQTECEKKPDFTTVLTTTAIGNHLITLCSDSVTKHFCRLATPLLKYTCSIIVGI